MEGYSNSDQVVEVKVSAMQKLLWQQGEFLHRGNIS